MLILLCHSPIKQCVLSVVVKAGQFNILVEVLVAGYTTSGCDIWQPSLELPFASGW
jgi:hypothetical protein